MVELIAARSKKMAKDKLQKQKRRLNSQEKSYKRRLQNEQQFQVWAPFKLQNTTT